MDTSTTPMPAALPDDVRKRIDTYQPRALTTAEWDECRESVITLVAAAPPADAVDAADLLSSATAFIDAVGAKAGTRDLPTLLEGPWLDRFADDWRAAGRSANYLRNHLAALKRLRRTAAGEDGSRRIRRIDRTPPTSTRPYGAIELDALRQAAKAAPPEIAATISTALELAATGVVVPTAYEHGLSRDTWERARQWVKTHRLPSLDALELRRSWVLATATTTTLLDCLSSGVTRNELDRVLPHLEPGDPQAVTAVLRAM